MSANSNFSRRFFADFIASRIRAWKLEGARSEAPGRCAAQGSGGSTAGGKLQSDTEARRDAAGSDIRRPRLPDLTDPRRPHGLGIG
jgi:hypothetical protein